RRHRRITTGRFTGTGALLAGLAEITGQSAGATVEVVARGDDAGLAAAREARRAAHRTKPGSAHLGGRADDAAVAAMRRVGRRVDTHTSALAERQLTGRIPAAGSPSRQRRARGDHAEGIARAARARH